MEADDLTADDRAFIFALVEEAVSCNDIERQDKALEVREKLPEPSFSDVRRWK